MRLTRWLVMACAAALSAAASAQTSERVVDIPTRQGVTQRVLVLAPAAPKATLILFAGGHGGLQIFPTGSMRGSDRNFLVRSRQLFADQGVAVAIVDAPSDRQSPPYLRGFRQTPEHVADIKAVIAWARANIGAPVWLVGTSRGTQSVAHAATELTGSDGPDGIVLSSTILTDRLEPAVPAMPLERIRVPVLVVHHEQDGCRLCNFADLPALTSKLTNAPRTQVLSFKGGESTGDPCGALAHHGYNGLEAEVVRQIVSWIVGS